MAKNIFCTIIYLFIFMLFFTHPNKQRIFFTLFLLIFIHPNNTFFFLFDFTHNPKKKKNSVSKFAKDNEGGPL